jgi:hypothetical protein
MSAKISFNWYITYGAPPLLIEPFIDASLVILMLALF